MSAQWDILPSENLLLKRKESDLGCTVQGKGHRTRRSKVETRTDEGVERQNVMPTVVLFSSASNEKQT